MLPGELGHCNRETIMHRDHSNLLTDLRDVGSLTIDAITGITDIVESLHHTITNFTGIVGAPDQYRTKGHALKHRPSTRPLLYQA